MLSCYTRPKHQLLEVILLKEGRKPRAKRSCILFLLTSWLQLCIISSALMLTPIENVCLQPAGYQLIFTQCCKSAWSFLEQLPQSRLHVLLLICVRTEYTLITVGQQWRGAKMFYRVLLRVMHLCFLASLRKSGFSILKSKKDSLPNFHQHL